MNASEQLNKITRFKRSQARKERIDFVRTVDDVKSLKLKFCACRVDFREWIESGESRVTGAVLCQLAYLCENCALRRQSKLAVRTEEKILTVMEQRPDLIPLHLTFGVKTGPDLIERFNHLRGCIRQMCEGSRKAGAATSHNRKSWELSKVLGAVRGLEFVRSKSDGMWNVHGHWFGMCSDYLDLEKFSHELRHVSGDSFIVHASKIRAKTEDSDPVRSAIAEVVKYPLKFAGLDPRDAWEAHTRLKGRRMFDSIGLLRGIAPGDLKLDDQGDELTGPHRDFIAWWMDNTESFRIQDANQFAETLTQRQK